MWYENVFRKDSDVELEKFWQFVVDITCELG